VVGGDFCFCLSGGAPVAAVGTPASCPAGSVSTPSAQTVSGKWSSVSPRFSIDYRWSPEVMTYISAAKGYKGGGFNDGIQTRCYRSPLPNCGLNEYLPENLWTYEAGIRTDLFDRRVRLNITAFLTKYKDQQIQLADPGPPPLVYTVNGDSTVKGFEAEFLARPTQNLVLKASVGYVDASYDKDIRGASGAVAVTSAVPFYRSPKWSYTLGASYTVPMGESGDVAFDFNLQTIQLPEKRWHPDFMSTGGKEYGLSEAIMPELLKVMSPDQTTSGSLRLGDLVIVGSARPDAK